MTRRGWGRSRGCVYVGSKVNTVMEFLACCSPFELLSCTVIYTNIQYTYYMFYTPRITKRSKLSCTIHSCPLTVLGFYTLIKSRVISVNGNNLANEINTSPYHVQSFHWKLSQKYKIDAGWSYDLQLPDVLSYLERIVIFKGFRCVSSCAPKWRSAQKVTACASQAYFDISFCPIITIFTVF